MIKKLLRIPLLGMLCVVALSLALTACGGQDAPAEEEPVAETEAVEAEAAWEDPDCVDANGNPTVYACVELDGEDLVSLLESEGYSWSSYDECFLRDSDRAALGVMDADQNLLGEDEIAALPKGGGSEGLYLINSLGGYDTLAEALDGGLGMELADESYHSADDLVFALVQNSEGQQYLLFGSVHVDGSGEPDGTMDLSLLNDQAVAAGMFETLTGLGGYGSVADVWSAYTSGEIVIG